jgi:cytochrome c-type biogenesis protein CcmE
VPITETGLDLTPVEPPHTAKKTRRRTTLVVMVVVLALGGLLSQGLLHSLDFFKTVDEVAAQRSAVGRSEIRLEGTVQSGSVTRTSTGATFILRGSGKSSAFVVAHAQPPQLFRGNIPVVAVGRFTTKLGWTFDCSQIMVKHTADYKAAHPQRVKASDGTVR